MWTRVISNFLMLLFMAALPGAAIGQLSQRESFNESLQAPSSSSDTSQQIMVGEVEDVMLAPGTITLPARIDTGSALCSLDARDLSVRDNMADFMLGKRYGSVRLRLPVVDWIYVRNAAGVEKRPVVKLGICLGSKFIRTVATLKDRSQMTYPFLVGRNVLKDGFMVDARRFRATRPRCPSSAFLASKALDATPISPSPKSE
jgi:hypothetical protein